MSIEVVGTRTWLLRYLGGNFCIFSDFVIFLLHFGRSIQITKGYFHFFLVFLLCAPFSGLELMFWWSGGRCPDCSCFLYSLFFSWLFAFVICWFRSHGSPCRSPVVGALSSLFLLVSPWLPVRELVKSMFKVCVTVCCCSPGVHSSCSRWFVALICCCDFSLLCMLVMVFINLPGYDLLRWYWEIQRTGPVCFAKPIVTYCNSVTV